MLALQESSGFEVMKEDELYYINGGSGTSISVNFSAGYQNGNVGIGFTVTTTSDNVTTTFKAEFSAGVSGITLSCEYSKTSSSC